MADAEIRETIATPIPNGLAVRIQISDAPLTAGNATILLDLRVTLPDYEAPMVAQVQRQAIRAVMDVLRGFSESLAQEIQRDPHHDLEPKPKQQFVRRQ